jgi:hypothetical protein
MQRAGGNALNLLQQGIVGGLSNVVVEDLDFDRFVEAARVDGLPPPAKFDDSKSHRGSTHQDSGIRARCCRSTSLRGGQRFPVRVWRIL